MRLIDAIMSSRIMRVPQMVIAIAWCLLTMLGALAGFALGGGTGAVLASNAGMAVFIFVLCPLMIAYDYCKSGWSRLRGRP